MSNSFNHWEDIANALIPACEEAVDSTAEAAANHMSQQIVTNGQVDTGEMRDSVYTVSQRGSTYKSSEHALPEIPVPESSTEADVAPAASYSVFQNNGTVYLPPRPFVEPAMDSARADFDKAIEGIAKKLEEAGKS